VTNYAAFPFRRAYVAKPAAAEAATKAARQTSDKQAKAASYE